MQPESDPFGGRLVDRRYRVVRALGRGGMATVYLAEDTKLAREVVLKVPHPQYLADEQFRRRFLLEIRNLVGLGHPGIVKVLDAGTQDDIPFAVMEYLSGGSLEDRLEAMDLRAPLASRLFWLMPAARALDFVHRQGVIHRDVKPSNILFDGEGNTFLGDFGIAKALGGVDTGITVLNATPGSPMYMAPEGVEADVPLTPAYDQYSLATVVYEAVSGFHPYKADTPMQVLFAKKHEDPRALDGADVPPPLREVLDRGLARDTSRRFGSCVELAEHVLGAVGGPVEPAPGAVGPAGAGGRLGPEDATIAEVDLEEVSRSGRSGPHIPWRWVVAIVVTGAGLATFLARDRIALFLATSGVVANPIAERHVVPGLEDSGVAFELQRVEPGEFVMGNPGAGRDRPTEGAVGATARIEITRPYWIGRYEVTEAQYLASDPDDAADRRRPTSRKPVVDVSWLDAVRYCEWLTDRERGRGRLPTGMVYRLPTEAEWERACFGSSAADRSAKAAALAALQTDVDQRASFRANTGGDLRPVGAEVPQNALGIYNMLGNVSEWCLDAVDSVSGTEKLDGVLADGARDPVGRGGAGRAVRGGSVEVVEETEMSPTIRRRAAPGDRRRSRGFRVVLGPALVGSADS